MKRVLALLLALTMIFSLAACAAKEDTPEPSAETTEQPAEPAAEPAAEEPAEAPEEPSEPKPDPVTIKVASYRAEDEALYTEIISRFQEAYPWITVELDLNADQTSYDQNIQADLMDGKAADVFDMHTNPTYITYAQEGVLLPMDDMAFLANYQDGAREITTVEGSVYGFLNTYNMISILYNKAIFEKEGLSEPANFEEFVTLCQTLRDKGYGGVSYPGGAVSYGWLTNALLTICLGGDGYKDLIEGMDSGKYTDITTIPGVAEALKTEQAYRDNNILYDASDATALDQCLSLFAQEMAPMMMMGTWTFGTRETDFPGLDVGVFALPTLLDTGEHYAEGGQLTVINAASENVEAAKLWVEFLASPETASYYCSNAKTISTIEGVGLDYEGGDVLAEAASHGINLLPTYVRNNKDYWNTNWKELLNGLLYGDMNYDDAIADYTAFLTELDLASLS